MTESKLRGDSEASKREKKLKDATQKRSQQHEASEAYEDRETTTERSCPSQWHGCVSITLVYTSIGYNPVAQSQAAPSTIFRCGVGFYPAVPFCLPFRETSGTACIFTPSHNWLQGMLVSTSARIFLLAYRTSICR